jgi:DNA replication protein DnaC
VWKAALPRYDLIILDKLGFIPFSKENAEALFSFYTARYESDSLIITTNLEFAHWKEIFGDEALSGVISRTTLLITATSSR